MEVIELTEDEDQVLNQDLTDKNVKVEEKEVDKADVNNSDSNANKESLKESGDSSSGKNIALQVFFFFFLGI